MSKKKWIALLFLFIIIYNFNSFSASTVLLPESDSLLTNYQPVTETSSAPLTMQPNDSLLAKPAETEFVPKWYDMFANIPSNWVRYAKETFTQEMIPPIVGMTVLTGALIITDEDSWKACRGWYDRSNTVRKASDIFVYMGDGTFQFGISAAFAAYGFTFGDAKALRTASQVTEVILTAGGVIQVLKHLTGRESPIVRTVKGGRWDFFPNQIEYHKHVPHYDAFPSGHICTATATLVVIMDNYPDATWLKPVGYTLLGCISTALITTSIHWWSDIPLGIAIGYAFGKISSNPLDIQLKKDSEDKTKTSLKLLPTYTQAGPGFSLNLTF